MKVDFLELNSQSQLTYSVIVSKDEKGFVFVKHKNRKTWEIPGGRIENKETPLEAANRELIEETGAAEFRIVAVCDYSVTIDNSTTFGRLFFAEIDKYSNKLNYETEKVESFNVLPTALTYPSIQPYLFNEVLKRVNLYNQQ